MQKMLTIIFLFLLPLSLASSTDPAPDLRLHGVKIKVADMDKALDFYGNIMGFEVLWKNPQEAALKNDGIALYLSQTERNKHIDYPHAEQTVITFQANDLKATMKSLKAKGVEFLFDEPRKVGVGIAAKFKDPFGNVHSLLEQQVGETPAFDEPRIYNVGYYLSDVAAARKFYCDQLGFVVRTEKYYPPALPLGHQDGSFGFMLHKAADATAAEIDYEKDSQSVLVFESPDLTKTIDYLHRENIKVLHKKPRQSTQGKYIVFVNPAGLPMEIIERSSVDKPSMSQPTDEAVMPVVKIEQMSWLAGHWIGDGLGGISEEMWTPPSAGVMMGMYRSIKDDKISFYEFLTIIEQDGSLVMRLKHFTPEFVGWENKEDFLEWPLQEISPNQANFGALQIKRQGDELFMTLKMKNKEGKIWEEKFKFRRVTDLGTY